MTSYRDFFRPLRLSMVGLAVCAATACAPSDVLEVQDPDIVNPSDVQSAAGAEAVRLGAIARLNASTSGAEGYFLLGGLFSDEWNNGDSFIARQEIDQRIITPQNNFLTDANRALHRARLSGEQAIALIAEYNPTAPAWHTAEMYFVQAFAINLMAEHLCNGLVFSTVVNGEEQLGTPITTAAAFAQALTLAETGLSKITGTTTNDVRVKSALQVLRGRILLNLNRPADAATAVTGVANNFRYESRHSQTTASNATWSFNNIARRYSVSTGEGTNGLPFATAADPRVPVCTGGDAACRAIGVTRNDRDDLTRPFYVQMIWPTADASAAFVTGIEARLIEAEAQLRASNAAGALTTLNAARTTVTGLAPLTLAATTAAQVDQLFRERAFWMFGTGHRTGDLRRLIKQYGRQANAVFPTGAWHKGGNYGADVTMPVPLAESNNPNVSADNTCIDRNP